jgi:hypothetical protein
LPFDAPKEEKKCLNKIAVGFTKKELFIKKEVFYGKWNT